MGGGDRNANDVSTAFIMPIGKTTITALYKNAPPASVDKSALETRIDTIGNTHKGNLLMIAEYFPKCFEYSEIGYLPGVTVSQTTALAVSFWL